MEIFKMLIDKYLYMYVKYFQWKIIQTNFLFLLSNYTNHTLVFETIYKHYNLKYYQNKNHIIYGT